MDLPREIKYGTPLHDKVKKAVRDRFELSQRKMASYHTTWDRVEELYRLYVKRDEEDSLRKSRRDTKGQQQFVTLNIPYSYAILLAAHTYWHSVFLSRNPILQYSGRHGESQQKVQAVEALIDYQVQVGEMLVPFDLWMLDAGKYGLGVLGVYWTDEVQTVSKIVEVPETWLGVIPIPGKVKKQKEVQKIKGYSGHKVFNVSPYDFYPDPRVTLVKLQEGEFCGRMAWESWNSCLKKAEQGLYFNLESLETMLRTGGRDRSLGSHTVGLPVFDDDQLTGPGGKNFVEDIEMDIELCPKEWGLGKTNSPEKWIFTLAQGDVVVGARPRGDYHNKYPYFLQTYELESRGHMPRGILELTEELNKAMSWLFNSHWFNVRKALNDQAIVDPSRVNMADLLEGGPGKLIRLRASAYGTDVRSVYTQLPVVDVTASHLGDAQIIGELIQRVVGVNDSLMGMLNPRGRKTATEVRQASSFGINRMKTVAEFNSALGWGPFAQVLLQGTQQRYDEEQMFRVAGDLIEPGMSFAKVDPEIIAGAFDYVPVDGSMPIDRMAQATLWKEILAGLPAMPQVAMTYDVGRIFAWMAQLAGLKNISQFKIKVIPDQQVSQGLNSGELMPAGAGVSPAIGGATMADMLGQNPQGSNGQG